MASRSPPPPDAGPDSPTPRARPLARFARAGRSVVLIIRAGRMEAQRVCEMVGWLYNRSA